MVLFGLIWWFVVVQLYTQFSHPTMPGTDQQVYYCGWRVGCFEINLSLYLYSKAQAIDQDQAEQKHVLLNEQSAEDLKKHGDHLEIARKRWSYYSINIEHLICWSTLCQCMSGTTQQKTSRTSSGMFFQGFTVQDIDLLSSMIQGYYFLF